MSSSASTNNPDHRPSFYTAKPIGNGMQRTDIECSCGEWKGFGTGNTKAFSREDAYRAHSEHVAPPRPAPTPGDERVATGCLFVVAAAVVAVLVVLVVNIGGGDRGTDTVYDEAECSALQGSIKNEDAFTPNEIQDFVREYNANC